MTFLVSQFSGTQSEFSLDSRCCQKVAEATGKTVDFVFAYAYRIFSSKPRKFFCPVLKEVKIFDNKSHIVDFSKQKSSNKVWYIPPWFWNIPGRPKPRMRLMGVISPTVWYKCTIYYPPKDDWEIRRNSSKKMRDRIIPDTRNNPSSGLGLLGRVLGRTLGHKSRLSKGKTTLKKVKRR
jgi:hypothetical protein